MGWALQSAAPMVERRGRSPSRSPSPVQKRRNSATGISTPQVSGVEGGGLGQSRSAELNTSSSGLDARGEGVQAEESWHQGGAANAGDAPRGGEGGGSDSMNCIACNRPLPRKPEQLPW